MLDTGSGPNIIKETFIPKGRTIDYNNILKLNGINEYPVYTLGKITLSVFGKEVIFHIVSSDFPISQAGILGNDFFEQNSSKIDYAKGYLDISGIKVPFLSPETVIAPPRTESLFYVRVENPEIKIGYIPRIKIAHGIYLGDTIVEAVSGKAYLNIISTLDEEVEVQVPTLRLKPLDELFDNHKLTIEKQDDRTKTTDIQVDFSGLNHQERKEMPNCDADLKNSKVEFIDNNEDGKFEENMILNKVKKDINNTTQNRGESKVIEKIQEITRGNKKLNKNFNPEEGSQTFTETLDFEIHGGGSYQTPPETQVNSKILGEGNFQTSLEKLSNSKILGEESCHTSSKNQFIFT